MKKLKILVINAFPELFVPVFYLENEHEVTKVYSVEELDNIKKHQGFGDFDLIFWDPVMPPGRSLNPEEIKEADGGIQTGKVLYKKYNMENLPKARIIIWTNPVSGKDYFWGSNVIAVIKKGIKKNSLINAIHLIED